MTQLAGTAPRLGRRSSPLRFDRVFAVVAVGVLAPLVAVLVSIAELQVVAIVGGATILLLIVLWSAEASFYVLVFSMLLSPEFIVGDLGSASAVTASRGVTLRFDDYVIFIIALAWLVRLAVYKEAAVLRRTPLNAPIFAYLGISALATMVGAMTGRVEPVTGFFFVLKYFEYTVIYFLVVNYVRDRDQVRRLIGATLLTAVIISIVSMAQIPSGARVTAPFEGEEGEPNTLGGYLVLMIALGLAFLTESVDHGSRIFWASMVGLMTVPLVFTYSRTSWLAFCVMLTSLVLLSRRRTFVFFLIAAGLVALIVSPPATIIERATFTLSEQRDSIVFLGFTIEPSAAARIEAWSSAANAVALYPILGAGVTGYGLIDAQYPRTIAETGIVGMGIFLWLVWRLLQAGVALRERATTATERALATGYLAGLLGLLMHGIGANTFIIVRIMEPLWLIVGLVVASVMFYETAAATSDPDALEAAAT